MTSVHGQQAVLLAVAGLCGTGKSEAAAHLEQLTGGESLYLGGLILSEIKKRGQAVTPAVERTVQLEVRNQLGPAALAVLAQDTVRKVLARGQTLVVDAIFVWEEFQHLQKCCGNHKAVLISIHAPFQLRCARLGKRLVRPLTSDEIIKRDQNETLRLGTGVPIALGDYHVVNDGTLAEYHKKLGQICGQL